MKRFFFWMFLLVIFLSFIMSVRADELDDINNAINSLKKDLNSKEANYQDLNVRLNGIKSKLNQLELEINKKEVEKIERELPEMPVEKLEKLLKKYKVEKADAEILIKNLELVDFFEAFVSVEKVNASKYISWITIELLRVLNYNRKTLEDSDVDIKPEHLAELISLVDKGKITVLKAKEIMNDFVPKSFSVSEKGDIENIPKEAIENLCKQVIEQNKKIVDDYKSGKKESLNFLMGQVMRLSNRRADFKIAKNILEDLLD